MLNTKAAPDHLAAATGAKSSPASELISHYTKLGDCIAMLVESASMKASSPKAEVVDSTESYTPKEVAQKLRLNEATVRELCRTGQLKAIKVGTLWRVPHAFLMEFVEGGGTNDIS